jgi:hypothetical protein
MIGMVILVQKGETPMIVVVEAVEKLKSLENIIRNLKGPRNLKSPRNPDVKYLDLFFFIFFYLTLNVLYNVYYFRDKLPYHCNIFSRVYIREPF